MNPLEQFNKMKYLNLETFRKSGESMKTPVWFTQVGQTIYIRTGANSGKVKRIRNNARVNIVPCKIDGKPTGTWVPAQAREVTDPEINTLVDGLLGKKYGLLKYLQSARTHMKDTILEIKIIE